MKFMITIGATAQGWRQGKVPITIAQSKVKITKAKKKKKKRKKFLFHIHNSCVNSLFLFPFIMTHISTKNMAPLPT